MALSISKTKDTVAGDVRIATGVIQFDSSYPTNGEAIAASDFGWKKLFHIVLEGQTNVATKTASFDSAASKLKVWVEDGTSGIAAEAGNTSDQSAVKVNFFAIGF